MSNISTHFEMLMDAKEQERIGATPDTDESMRVMRALSHYEEMRSALEFIAKTVDTSQTCSPGNESIAVRAMDAIGK